MIKRVILRIIRWLSVSGNVYVGARVHIGFGSVLSSINGLKVESDVYIGKYCTIQCDGRIGRGALIANNVGIIGRVDHDFRSVGRLMRYAPWVGDADFPAHLRARSAVDIGEDCWIGFGAIVLSGITIGRGSVVAAGSVVTEHVPPYAIVAGNPARPAGTRFSAAEIAVHEAALQPSTRT